MDLLDGCKYKIYNMTTYNLPELLKQFEISIYLSAFQVFFSPISLFSNIN